MHTISTSLARIYLRVSTFHEVRYHGALSRIQHESQTILNRTDLQLVWANLHWRVRERQSGFRTQIRRLWIPLKQVLERLSHSEASFAGHKMLKIISLADVG